MDVLRALQKASTGRKPGEVEKACQKENWEVGQNADLKLFATGCAERAMDAETLSVLSLNAYQVDNMVGILKALLETASEIQHEYERCLTPVLSKLSKGIAAIPDELLALIFKHNAATYGRKQAIRLSHVSRRFRGVALSEHNLWTTLHSGARKEELETFALRSGQDTGLHIVVRNHPGLSVPKFFLDACLAVSHRWKSLDIEETSHDFVPPEVRSLMWDLKMDEGSHMHLPRLEELRIASIQRNELGPRLGTQSPVHVRQKFAWTSPRLRKLELENFSLFYTSAFASLISYSYTFELEWDCDSRIKELHSFLAETSSISTLRLDFSNFIGLSEDEFHLPDIHCRSVTSLDLCFSEYTFGERAEEFIAALTKALHVPNVQELSLAVNFRYADVVNLNNRGENGTEHLERLSDSLLPANHTRSHLTMLTYKFGYEVSRRWASMKPPVDFTGTFTIPLDRISNVTSLTVTTFTGVRFSREGSVSLVQSHLHRLHFRECNKLDGRVTVRSLKDVGVWEQIEELVLEDCASHKGKMVLDAVEKEELGRLWDL
ncbi:hypothetical protein SCHPADRAFT_933899 [Schizopora paradoxa]|uniref:F-box domain-containing protein n=1 Tax=Schizopora paradoxa TaxID=27342 RepID=A0A0H2QZ10_9AGAM|nr:hypothetical protein SCHPADRAFT_933899 [Schizopora paradoxa]